MAAPTFIQEAETAWNSSTTPKVTPSFNVLAGDTLVACAINESASFGGGATLSTPSGGSLTWNLQQSIAVSSNTAVSIWTATVDSDKSMTVSFAQTGGAAWFGGNVLTFRGSDGVGASQKTNASGAPSRAITTTQDDSAIVAFVGDWNAVDGASRTWRTINSITPTSGNGLERTYFRDGSHYTVYGAYWSNVGTAGSKTTGISAPTGQQYSIIAVEIKGSAGGGAIEEEIGLSSETDSALAHARRKSKAVGLNSETDSSLTATSRKSKAIGLNAETDTALALTVVKSRTLGLASETDSALAVDNNPIRRLLSQASETDTALALTARKSLAIGLASETDTAQAHTSRKTLAIGLASETDSALSLTGGVTIAIGLVTETDSALAATAAKQKAVGLSSETDSALALTARKTLAAGLASETESALAATSLKTRTLGLATESDSSLAATSSKSKAIGLASESESALAATVGRSRTIGIAAETDSAFGLAVRKALEIGLAVEADTALTLGDRLAPITIVCGYYIPGAVHAQGYAPGVVKAGSYAPGAVKMQGKQA